MNKKYIKPTVKAAVINDSPILAGSNFGVDNDDNDYKKDDFGAKRSSFADDNKPWGSIW